MEKKLFDSEFGKVLCGAKNPMVIVSASVFPGAGGMALHGMLRGMADDFGMVRDGWNGFNVVHSAAARVGALMAGFVPQGDGKGTRQILSGAQDGSVGLVYLLGADEIEPTDFGNAFVIYQGHHGDRGAHRADLILPGAAYTEKTATYVNTEGRAQVSRMAVFPPGEAREDWKIIRALSEAAGRTLPFDSLGDLRRVMAENPCFRNPGQPFRADWGSFGGSGQVQNHAFESPLHNYYMTDPISRASVSMAKCTEEFLEGPLLAKTGTDR